MIRQRLEGKLHYGKKNSHGEAHGEGITKWQKGYTVQGTWKNGDAHGCMAYIWKGKGRAIGEAKNSLWHGKMTHYW